MLAKHTSSTDSAETAYTTTPIYPFVAKEDAEGLSHETNEFVTVNVVRGLDPKVNRPFACKLRRANPGVGEPVYLPLAVASSCSGGGAARGVRERAEQYTVDHWDSYAGHNIKAGTCAARQLQS